MNYNIIISIFLMFFLYQCDEKNSNQYQNGEISIKNNRSINKRDSLSLFNDYEEKYDSITINCDSKTSLVIENKYIIVPDSISFYRPLFLSQKLLFYDKNKFIKTINFPFHKKEITLYKKPLTVNTTTICGIKCHKDKKGNWIYNIYGSYNFDPPHEFFGLISDKGDWLWYYYGERNETYKRFGQIEKYLQEFGQEINSLKDMTQVCPS